MIGWLPFVLLGVCGRRDCCRRDCRRCDGVRRSGRRGVGSGASSVCPISSGLVRVTKSAMRQTAAVGEEIEVELTVENGGRTAFDVLVCDDLGRDAFFVPESTAVNGAVSDQAIENGIRLTLEPSEIATVNYRFRCCRAGCLSTRAAAEFVPHGSHWQCATAECAVSNPFAFRFDEPFCPWGI